MDLQAVPGSQYIGEDTEPLKQNVFVTFMNYSGQVIYRYVMYTTYLE